MNRAIQEEISQFKEEALAEHRIDPEDASLPPDVRQLVKLIHDNLISEKLTVESLQEQPGVSRKTTGRFSGKFEIPTKAYITKLRVELARKLITKEEATLMSVALRVGFRDHSTLTKAFKKHAEYLPSEITNGKVKNGGVKISNNFSNKNSSMRT